MTNHNIIDKHIIVYMLWFSFIYGLNFIFLCFKLIIIHYYTSGKKNKIQAKDIETEPKQVSWIQPVIKHNISSQYIVLLHFTWKSIYFDVLTYVFRISISPSSRARRGKNDNKIFNERSESWFPCAIVVRKMSVVSLISPVVIWYDSKYHSHLGLAYRLFSRRL